MMQVRSTGVAMLVAASTAILAPLAWLAPATADALEAATIFEEVGLSKQQIAQVEAGEFVTLDVEARSERDLSLSFVFSVDVSPQELVDQVWAGAANEVDPNLIATGEIKTGTEAEFAKLTLGPEPAAMAKLYGTAKPGSDLNLSTKEIAAFGAFGAGASQDAVLEALRSMLLVRYQAYRASGLAGIAAYDRGGGKSTNPAADLEEVSKNYVVVKKEVPDAYAAILSYPKDEPAGFKERFDWTLYNAHDEPTYILTHRFVVPAGDAVVAIQRQFYVSRGFNNEQAIAAFLPVEKGTVVVYANHTSTEQVAGFGGSAKRSIGRKLMASQLRALFEKTRAKIEGK